MVDLKDIAPPYRVQSTEGVEGDGFPVFAHHQSVSSLWETKWRPVCCRGIYPFTDADVADFDPVFADLIARSGDDPAILYQPDAYAAPFFPVAEMLVSHAEQAAAEGDNAAARSLFLRAAAVYRIARFPINRTALSEDAWTRGKAAYERGGALLEPPSTSIAIPFSHGDRSAGDELVPIQAYVRLPGGDRPAGGWPVLLFICGLDAYRTDHTPRTQQHGDRGYATISFEIPGTGDCPAAPRDPASPDRLMSSIFEWLTIAAPEYGFDQSRIIARGVSTGGYYAFRAAHTHADRLFAVVAQGGGSHHMFKADWIAAQDQMEYPFALAEALAYKFGFRDTDVAASVKQYAAEASRFSLVDGGVLDRPSCRSLVINGMEDSIFPVEDSLLVAMRGKGKDLVLRSDRGHMGNPGAEDMVYDWIDEAVTRARQP